MFFSHTQKDYFKLSLRYHGDSPGYLSRVGYYYPTQFAYNFRSTL